MHKLLYGWVLAVALLGGCKKPGGGSGDQTKAKRDTCVETGALLAQANAYLMTQAGKPKPTEAQEAGIASTITAECTTQGWTDDAATCYSATKGPEDLPPCDKKLTPAQKASYDNAVATAVAEVTAGKQVRAGSAALGSAAPAGSAGSAAVGSAAVGSAAPAGSGSATAGSAN